MNKLNIVVAVIVGYLLALTVVGMVHSDQTRQSVELQQTPVQRYNVTCMAYGNLYPCALVR